MLNGEACPPVLPIIPEDSREDGSFEVTDSATSERTGAAARSIASLPAVAIVGVG